MAKKKNPLVYGFLGALMAAIVLLPGLPASGIPGDLNGDGQVCRTDLDIILAARNTPADGPNDPRDVDGDGMITALDARKLVLLCTRPRCECEEVAPNTPPVANAGPDQTLFVGDTVQLDGSGSSDVDGDPLTFEWSFADVPEGSNATLSDSNAVDPTFAIDLTGIYEIELIVNDGTVDSNPDEVVITADPRIVQVPNVVGMFQVDAESVIIASGLTVGTITYQYSGTVPAGQVISQEPVAGISIEENSPVNLVVSLGPVPLPTVNISANPTVIMAGESSTLSWSSTNADSATIDQGIGDVPVSGSTTVSPATTTTYTITVTGPGGTATAGVMVSVIVDGGQVGYIDGEVYDASNDTPLEGALVTAVGVSWEIRSDGEGRFFFPITEDRKYILTIEKDGYTYAQRRARGVVGRDVAVDPVYLTPMDSSVTRITPDGGTHTDSTGRIEIIFRPGSVSEPVDVRTTMFERDRDLPYPLPPMSKFTMALNLKPENLVLQVPALLRIDNFLGFPPGTPVPVGIYTKQSAKWEADGMAIITVDGSAMEYETSHFSNLDCNFPVAPDEDSGAMKEIKNKTPQKNHRCEEDGPQGSAKVGLRTGNLYSSHELSRYRSLGIWQGVILEYNSLSARPTAMILAEADLDPIEMLIPETIGFTLRIEGIRREVTFEADEGRGRYALHFDGRNARGELLPTGSYPFRVDISNNYRGNYYTADYFGGPALYDTGVPSRETFPLNNYFYGWIPLHNESRSPFGSGWGVRGLGRLHIDPQGKSVLVTEGSTYAGVFVSVGAYRLMEPDCVMSLSGVGVDGNDQLYFTGGHRVWRRNSDGNLTVVAGTGEFGFDGDGGPATEAMLWSPADVAFDSQGNMYIADTGNDRIRRVDASGIITTYAGSGEPGFGGDGGPATDARLSSPVGVAVDSSGNLYIVDNLNMRIRKVDTSGIITTYAGSGLPGSVGDGGPAAEAQLSFPNDIALDSEGDLYIADTRNHRVRKVDVDGIITTVAGTGVGGFSGNGGAAVHAQIWRPYDVAVDGEGNLYIADYYNARIRKVDTNGIITTWVGGGVGTEDAIPSTDAGISPPHAIAMDSRGTLYIGQVPRFGQCYPVSKVVDHAIGEPHEVFFDSPRGDFTKLRQNPDLTFTRTLEDGTEIHFNQKGLHVETVDLNGNTTLYSYDGEDRLVTITDPRGQITQFEYGAGGKLSRIIDPAGRVTSFTVDTNGDLASVTDPAGAVTSYSYAGHLLTSSTDPRGNTTDYVYDPAYGWISEVRYPTGEVRTFSHSNILGLINEIPFGIGTPGNPAPIIRPEGIRASFTDGEGKTWTFRTNRFGHIIEREDPLGRVTLVDRDLDSLPTRIELPNGEVFEIYWNERGSPTGIYQQSIDARTTIMYPSSPFPPYTPKHNKPDSITDAEGNGLSFRYDDYGNITELRLAWGRYYYLAYAEGGLLESVTDPLGKITSFAHNGLGNIETVTDPLGNTMTYGYDVAGNITSITDANGNTTTYTYDDMNRLIEVIDAEGNTTGYSYDGKGLLSSITDANGNATQFAYDEIGQLLSATQPLGQTKAFDYYLNRNLRSITTPRGDLIRFIYDDEGKLIEKQLPEGSVAYDYDDVGNLTFVDNGASIITMVYDLASRLTQVSTSATAHQPATAIAYGYDKVGDRVSMNDGTGTTTYVYNNTYEVTDLTSPIGHTGFTYDSLGRRQIATLPNGISATFTYDDAGRLSNLTNQGVSSFDYTHDNVGNRFSMTTAAGAHNYAYDNIYQLTGATHPTSPTESFTYDGVGNRLSSADYPDWAYDTNNRLTGYGGITYTYDENGNMITRTDASGMTTYTYDSENKLVRIDLPGGGFAEYVYDGLSRRIEKNVDGTVTRYVYDLEDILFEYDSTNTITARYTHVPGIDDPIGMDRGGKSYFYHADGLGSITDITDSTGTVVASYQYDAFGNITSQTGSLTNPYTYTGREYDPESDLYYYRARYYDPIIGRFLSEDPIGFWIGYVNLYGYCLNNPIMFIDPLGLLLSLYSGGDASKIANTWDPVTNKRILQLDPRIQQAATDFINVAESKLGIRLRITSGYRSIEEQNALYAIGRPGGPPGKIVTKARGGQSPHNFGLAIDVVEMVNGRPNWNTDWDAIGALGKSCGFEWGGDWPKFKDRPHFQMHWP